MIDPRFREIFEFVDELEADGTPTTRAKLAIKIKAYAQDVDNQREELATLEEDVTDLQASVDAQEAALEEQAVRKTELVSDAQDAAVRAAMSGSGGAGARLRKLAEDTRDRINQFDKDVDQDTNRLEQSRISLAAKQRAIRDARGMIVRRLNTMSSLAERAGVEFGTELFAQHSQPQQSQRMALPRATRRRPRRVRVRRRRAS